ncbi:MAG: VWA-like domain-containing protein [Bacteroidales bacterium]|nr:VWA-like domain-containing protein [Bacteroidales bacterium]
MEIEKRITTILEHWFIQEPALFQVLCSHQMVENPNIECPVRCGRRKVEYNPFILENMTDQALDEAFRTEAVRILLKHPYERKPDQCCDQAIAIGSNVTVSDNYAYHSLNIETAEDFELKKGMPYEWYARKIQEILPPSSGGEDGEGHSSGKQSGSQGEGQGNGGDNEDKRSKAQRQLAELWEEDDLAITEINGIIDSIKEWGSVGGQFAEKLKASTKASINWRNIFSGFRASILSSDKKLTRMKPSRRYGFDAMGSTRKFTTRLLIAVDVSGSISSESLSYFYGVINSAFKYGFHDIDVIQFDCGCTSIQNLKNVIRDVTIIGRGGTSFQEPIDFAIEQGYDGLVILTDGYAPVPTVPDNCRTKILWVCEDESAYKAHHEWMEKLGRVCTINLK